MRSIILTCCAAKVMRSSRRPRAKSRWQIFEKEKIDLAILDLNLGGGSSGLDVLKKMRDSTAR